MKSIKTALKGLFILLLGGNLSALYAQANITVNASSVVTTIPSEIYGTNMSTYTSSNNGSDPAYVTAMQVSGSRNIRWPGGSYADFVNWNDLQCQGNFEVTTPEYISFLQKFGGQMQAIVNFSGKWCGTQYTHAQAVSLAAAWVSWNLTNTGSARAKYWEIGNEVYGSWETGGQGSAGSTLTGTVYGNYFADYYKAMKAVDPTILIGAVASPGASDYSNWTPRLLTAAKAAGVVPDFLIIHNYPDGATGTGSAFDATMLSYASLPANFTSSLNSLVSSNVGSSYVGQVKYFMTEYNSGGPSGPNVQCDEYINAMFVSQWIMECAKNGWIGANLWAAKNGGTPDYAFINTSTDAPFPDYYMFPMLTGKFGAGMVSCSSSNSSVRSYASKDSAGNLTLFMVNNNPTTSMPANVTVSGFTPASSGHAWVMLPSGTSSSGAPQEAPSISINGNVNPAPANLASIAGVAQTTGSTFTVNLQPSEMALIVIPPTGGTPQPTPTNTPCTPTAIIPYLQVNAGTWQQASSVTVSAGATVNLGPQPVTGGTWSWTGPNGFTSTSREIDNIPLGAGNNTFTATYTNACGLKTTQTFTITVQSAPTATFTFTPTSAAPTATFTHTPTPTSTPTPIVSSSWRVNAGGPAYTDTTSNIWASDENFSGGSVASGGAVTGTSDSTLYDTQRYGNSFSYSFFVPAGSYQVTLKFAETYSGDFSAGARVFNVAVNGSTVLSNLDVYAQVGANTADDKLINNVSPSGGIITIQFTGGSSTDTNAMVEAIQVIPQPATPTFTNTPTRTSSATGTPTATSTATRTSTATFTFTPTVTSTATASRTSTAVPPTATNTAIPPTSTFTSVPATATATNSPVPPTVTNTPAPPSPTVSQTPTNTYTFTGTVTNTPAPPTATNTAAPPTFTFTDTPVPPTTTDSMTPTASLTVTPTNSPVPPTVTNTPVPPTVTNTPAPPTVTSTSTAVPPSPTVSQTPTHTYTFTGTATFTNTFTHTNTPVPPTATFTPTPSGAAALTVELLSSITADSTNSPHPFIEVVNTGSGSLNLNNVEVRYWFNCDCTNQSIQTWVDWAGLMPAGTSVTNDVLHTTVATSQGGQTDYISYKFTGNLVLQPGQAIQIQSRFNKSDWSNMLQDNDWSYAAYTSYTPATKVTAYEGGSLVWGQEPSGSSAALKAASVIAYPNPSTGNGVNLAVNLSGNGTGSSNASAKALGSSDGEGIDPNAEVTLKAYTIDGRLIWSTTVSGASIGSTGNHSVYWNEKNYVGNYLANGLYIVTCTVKSQGQTSTATSKLLILR